jgi:SanA protein
LTALAGIVIAACNIVVNNHAEGRTFDTASEVSTCETAVLLGTNPKSRFHGHDNFFYKARIDATVALWKKGKFRKLIISGAKRPGYDEPTAMKRDLTKRGVPDSIIRLDGEGNRTYASVVNIKNVYHEDSVIVISQKWHNQRFIYIGDRLGLYAVGMNAEDFQDPLARLTHVRELLARVKMFVDFL